MFTPWLKNSPVLNEKLLIYIEPYYCTGTTKKIKSMIYFSGTYHREQGEGAGPQTVCRSRDFT